MSLLDVASNCDGWWDEMATWIVSSVVIESNTSSMGGGSIYLVGPRMQGNKPQDATLDLMPWDLDEVSKMFGGNVRAEVGYGMQLCEIAAHSPGCLPVWKEEQG